MGLIAAESLDVLKRKAHAFETAANDALPLLPGEAPPVDPATEWEMALTMLVTVAAPALPYLPTIYTPETIKALAAAVVPLANKYGLTVGGVMTGPEVGFLMVAGPLALATYVAHKQWRAEQDAARTVDNDAAPEAVAPRPQRAHLGDNMQDNGGRLHAVGG